MRIVPEAERMDARAPLALFVIAVVIIALSLLATLLLRSVGRREPPPGGLSLTPPAGLAVREVGSAPVQASWFLNPDSPPPSTRQLPEALNGYGWVDRERGVVRIPIARAKQLYLEQFQRERRDGTPPLTAPARHGGLR